MNKFFKLLLFYLILSLNYNAFAEIKIQYKVNDDIITNYDIIKEAEYLLALNKNLENLNKKSLLNRAKDSLIREKIKINEINKFYTVNYEEASNSEKLISILKSLRSNIGFNTDEEFENYLSTKNINLIDLKKKLLIEQLWNQLIFDKYSNKVNINYSEIDKRINEKINSNKEVINFDLSEIVFFEKTKELNDLKYNEIIASIKNIGFNETALIHSISESSKLGGKIGWVNENQISEKIFKNLEKLNKGEYSDQIVTSGGIIILKVDDKKIVSNKIDKEKEKQKMIASEKNRILNEYSLIFFKEIKTRAYVEKY